LDPTPLDNAEFAGSGGLLSALAGSGAVDRYDLVSAIVHGLGQAMGLDDLDASLNPVSIMADELALSTRRLPATADVDAVFAEGEF
jgi:hypothetical protein